MKQNILIIDDEESILYLSKTNLEKSGYVVDTMSDPEKALKLLEKQKYDLMITNLTMPKMNGFVLSKICKEKYPNMKIIFMTGYGYDYDSKINESIAKGECSCCIYKPFVFSSLYRTIKSVIDK